VNGSIFRQLFLSYSAIFLLLLFSLFSFLYIELSTYLDIRSSKEILLSTSIKRQQLETHLHQQFVNLKSWVKLDVMNDVLTQDADLRITKTLESFKKQYNLSGHLYVLSNSGSLIAADQEVAPTVNFSVWMPTIRANHTLIDKHVSPVDEQLIITLWQSIHASFNPSLVIGYLVMTYPWQEVENLQDFSDIHTHLVLFNKNLEIIVSDGYLSHIPTQKDLMSAMPQSWKSSLISKILISNPTTFGKTHNEISLGNSKFFMQKLENTNKTPLTNLWHWFSLANKAQFYTPLQNILKIGFFIGLIILFLTLTVIFFISRKISRPIKLLTDTAENLALTLDLSKRVPVHGKNELSRLAIAFNEMSLKLSNEWKEKKNALQYSRSLIEASLDPLVTISAEGKITDANLATETVTGVNRVSLIGSDFANYFTDPNEAREGYQQVFSQGYVMNYPLAIRHVSGKITDVLYNANVYYNENNEVAGVFAAARDADMALASTIFESQEGMFITDANSVIIRANKSFTKIIGDTTEETIGQTPRLFSSDLQDSHFYAAMWESLNNTNSWAGEIWNKRKTGEIFPGHLAITAVKDVNGIVTNYVATFTDITLSKAASDEIRSLAFYDPLTELPNRRLLLDRLNQALAVSSRKRQRGALLFLDLDQFKMLNDTLGHDMGDLLLQQVAARLTSSVRESDTVARLGGDEFVVLLEDLSEKNIEAADQAKEVAEKILFALNQPYQLNTYIHHSTPSIGATLFSGLDISVDELMKQADIAMYQSKAEGRNTLRFFDPIMQEAITSSVNMEQELRNAIKLKQFQLHYQIQVGSNGQSLGAEALIRWLNPERGMISPFNFIPLAEKSGLIIPIGQWVMDTACAQLSAWQQNPRTQDLVLAVNVSAKQFRQDNFVEQMLATIERHSINPTRLKLELTESMLVNNINDLIDKMNVLSNIGISFSLDDFGTGYSSLQYLKKLPLNQLKIDQSFVRDIVTDSCDQAIVRTIIVMADSLGFEVIAEGVETEEQRQKLINKGCTHFQGYLFSKPVPIDEFEVLLRKG